MKTCPAIELAKRFHALYESLAPSCSYKTHKASRVPWNKLPVANRILMVAVCEQLIREGWMKA
jgi:hypothetical protein